MRRAHYAQNERGVTMVLVAIAMVAIMSIAALSIDVITLYVAREEAQRSADAAALAAARVISISGMTGDPANTSSSWQAICGGAGSPASLAAIAVSTQRAVGGAVPTTTTVTYSAGGATGTQDCSTLPAAFGVNPMATVQISRASLPTFFSRIWGNTSNTVSAKATAEAFNPSASDLNGNVSSPNVTPVQPTCVKPLMLPNRDPFNAPGCTGAACNPFVTVADGSIVHPGVLPTTANGVIGETFNLFADCKPGTNCVRVNNQARANVIVGGFVGGGPPPTPNLEYLPGEITSSSIAVPTCGTSGSGSNLDYEPAVTGCDTTTKYQCGIPSASAATPNVIDLTENPGGPSGDTATGVACLMTNSNSTPASGQDILDTTSYPYKITAGSANPVGISGSVITSSNSIISLPIYDVSAPLVVTGNQAPVTIVGFLQAFVNSEGADGSLNVTVLNVAGCGNGATVGTNNPVSGSSPVPVRLITPP